LLRKTGDTWTASSTGTEYSLLAMDTLQGRGHPVRSRLSNHPEPGEQWTRNGRVWQGPSQWMPRTSANYAGVDGHVQRRTYPGTIYFYGPQPESVTSVGGLMIPDRFISKY